MSDIEREAFERHYASMNDGFCPTMYEGEYDWADAQRCWETWQSARQAPASGEVEPVACNCVGGWVEDTKGVVWPCPNGCDKKLTNVPGCIYNGPCDYKSPANTHPPAKVPEYDLVTDYARCLEALGCKVIVGEELPVCLGDMLDELLTTPTPATTAGTEWVKCEDRLPENESTVLAYVKDYADPMVVPARYSPNSEQWFDVEYVDRDGDQNTLYQVISWMPLPTPPQEQ